MRLLSRRATRPSSGSSSSSPASASPISFMDSKWRSHRVDVSYRRVFSIATAACAARSCVSSSSSSVKSPPPCLLGQVQVSVRHTAQEDRNAEEGLHRRVVGRKTDGARVVAEVVQPQGLRIADEHAEDSAASRQVADRGVGLRVDAGREEALQPLPGTVDHTQRGVPRPGELCRRLHELLQERIEREFGAQRDTRIDEDAEAVECGRL